MALRPLHILSVGTIKTPHWKDAANHYLQRLKHWRNIEHKTVKDGDSKLPIPERNAKEGQKILAALSPKHYIICLDEHGKTFTSKQFANFLQKVSEDNSKIPCFVVGGAFGFDESVKKACHYTLSLGPMTLPHELAHVLLLEQLYRAEAILRNIPYHHE